MKLQIVSKLVRKNSQNKQTSLSYSLIPSQTFNHQYYPQKYNKIDTDADHGHHRKTSQYADFFNFFQQNCIVTYSKKEDNTSNVRRKLESQLTNLQSIDHTAQKNSQIQFSFKKGSHIYSNDKNMTLQTEASETQVKNRGMYTRASSRGKLRKFNSLVILKGEAQQNATPFVTRPVLKKNTSSFKQSYFNLQKPTLISQTNRLSYNPSTSCAKVQNMEPKCYLLSHYDNRTQRFGEDIKQRLSKIRKELNMIYEEKKQPQFKLKLF